jgi:hypothetical protein
METRLKLSKTSSEVLVDATAFRSLVGSLRYLVNTQPDIAFSVGYVSMFLSEPHEDHLIVVKHILRYVAGTMNWGIMMKKGSGKTALVGFTNSDFAGDVDSRKITYGVFFFLNENPITWQSTKHSMVAESSCEAEYVAAANAACQALWLSRVLGELDSDKVVIPALMVDN